MLIAVSGREVWAGSLQLNPMIALPMAMISASDGHCLTTFEELHSFVLPRLPDFVYTVLPLTSIPCPRLQSDRKPPVSSFATHELFTNLQRPRVRSGGLHVSTTRQTHMKHHKRMVGFAPVKISRTPAIRYVCIHIPEVLVRMPQEIALKAVFRKDHEVFISLIIRASIVCVDSLLARIQAQNEIVANLSPGRNHARLACPKQWLKRS